MLDLGWSELLVIGIVALIVVGPKDLPRMLRTLGRYAAKAKSVAREFQRSMDDAARQADLDELRDVKKDLDRDVTAMRDEQYRLQREMSQSYMAKPKEPGAKPGAADAKGDAEGDGAAAGKGASPQPEAPKAEPPAAAPAAEPEPPRKVGGA